MQAGINATFEESNARRVASRCAGSMKSGAEATDSESSLWLLFFYFVQVNTGVCDQEREAYVEERGDVAIAGRIGEFCYLLPLVSCESESEQVNEKNL